MFSSLTGAAYGTNVKVIPFREDGLHLNSLISLSVLTVTVIFFYFATPAGV